MKQEEGYKKEIIWILIYTKQNEEKKASDNLQNQGFETFLPLIAPTNRNTEFTSLVPVFPRYIFARINMSLDNWASIKSSYGVSNIVMFSDEFTPIPDEIIQAIKDKLDASGIFKEDVSKVDYRKGDQVQIEQGRFAGVDAIFVSKKSKDRVRLLLKLLNTSVLAEIDKSDIKHKEVIKTFKF